MRTGVQVSVDFAINPNNKSGPIKLRRQMPLFLLALNTITVIALRLKMHWIIWAKNGVENQPHLLATG